MQIIHQNAGSVVIIRFVLNGHHIRLKTLNHGLVELILGQEKMFYGSAIPLNCEILNAYTSSASTSGDSKSTTWGRVGKVETRRPSTRRIYLCED